MGAAMVVDAPSTAPGRPKAVVSRRTDAGQAEWRGDDRPALPRGADVASTWEAEGKVADELWLRAARSSPSVERWRPSQAANPLSRMACTSTRRQVWGNEDYRGGDRGSKREGNGFGARCGKQRWHWRPGALVGTTAAGVVSHCGAPGTRSLRGLEVWPRARRGQARDDKHVSLYENVSMGWRRWFRACLCGHTNRAHLTSRQNVHVKLVELLFKPRNGALLHFGLTQELVRSQHDAQSEPCYFWPSPSALWQGRSSFFFFFLTYFFQKKI